MVEWHELYEYMNNILEPYDTSITALTKAVEDFHNQLQAVIKQINEINKALGAINNKIWNLEWRLEDLEKEVYGVANR